MILCYRSSTEPSYRDGPGTKSEVPEILHAYYDFRDELTAQDHLVFKGPHLVVPAHLRKEMMAVAHATQIDVEGCVRRAMYWLRMATELKEYISKCDICMAHWIHPARSPSICTILWHVLGPNLVPTYVIYRDAHYLSYMTITPIL